MVEFLEAVFYFFGSSIYLMVIGVGILVAIVWAPIYIVGGTAWRLLTTTREERESQARYWAERDREMRLEMAEARESIRRERYR